MHMAAPLAGMHVVMVFHVLFRGNGLTFSKIKQTANMELMEKWLAEKLLINILKVDVSWKEKQKRFCMRHASALNITVPNSLPTVSSHPNLIRINIVMLVAPEGGFKGFLSMFILLLNCKTEKAKDNQNFPLFFSRACGVCLHYIKLVV